MHCPTLSELPSAPLGKYGWPWTEERLPSERNLVSGNIWPLVSIVTPSYNQGQFLEEAIRSVLLQGYPNLEYIIIDGGSTDNSVEVIRKYEPWLAYWVSEPDRGKYHALNKGFRIAKGEILAWLNSDDRYEPSAASTSAAYLRDHPDVAMVYGDAYIIDERGQITDTWRSPAFDTRELLFKCIMPQPSVFFRRPVFAQLGPFDEGIDTAGDYGLWLQVAKRFSVHYIPGSRAGVRMWSETEMVAHPENFWPARYIFLTRFFESLPPDSELRRWEPDAYGIVLLHDALQQFQLGHVCQGKEAIEQAFKAALSLVQTQRERLTQMLIAYADGGRPWEETESYLRLVFGNLPSNAKPLVSLQANAKRRMQILKATRSQNPQMIRLARRLILPSLIHDLAWSLQRQVLPELFSLLVGPSITRATASTFGLFRGRRIAPHQQAD